MLTLNRRLLDLTPVEERNGIFYKRDDALAFSNGVNGKVRTSLYLAQLAKDAYADTLVYGGSVHAPALGRVASAAAYVGLGCILVMGSTAQSASRHATVRVALEAGARVETTKVAYNPALQKRARELAATSGGRVWQVPYGVSTPDDWDDDQLLDFIQQDAYQVQNLPAHTEQLVLPFGSGNAATAVLYGLAQDHWRPAELRYVKLVGIGPDRWEWLKARLARVGVDLDRLPFEVKVIPLHPTFAVYSDRMPETLDGIDFHETYEGKIIRFLNIAKPSWWTARDGRTAFWIVGGPLGATK